MMKEFHIDLFVLGIPKKETDLDITLDDRINELKYFTSYTLNIKCEKNKDYKLCGDDENFVRAYSTFEYVDSVTIDPHKQGYLPYPCGVIAFKNDRIRHLIEQKAPYITSSVNSALVHVPPRHSPTYFEEDSNEKQGDHISAFAPFILEGSKPGAAAASLWLTNKCIPLSVNGYGTIVRDSLLAARAFYERIVNNNSILYRPDENAKYEIIPLSDKQPDLNVVVFAIKPQKSATHKIITLKDMNDFTNEVYKKYSLQVEFGNREYSYGQPFFISKTTFSHPNYSHFALSDFFTRSGIKCSEEEYKTDSLTVLRVTVMNPYIWAYKKYKNTDLIRDFMLNLHHNILLILKEKEARTMLNDHVFVDLGLSVKWATCNVGANKPGEYGDYFAWGETSPKDKDKYNYNNVKYYLGKSSSNDSMFSKYCTDSKYGTVDNRTCLERSDDAARWQWGGSWRMPTGEEFKELLEQCQWSWTKKDDHKCYKVTGPNGNSIFLPAAGYRCGSSLNDAGKLGGYWSSSLYTSNSSSAYGLYFLSGSHGVGGDDRSLGQSVRPVIE